MRAGQLVCRHEVVHIRPSHSQKHRQPGRIELVDHRLRFRHRHSQSPGKGKQCASQVAEMPSLVALGLGGSERVLDLSDGHRELAWECVQI